MTARLPKKSNAKIKASNPAEKPIGKTITVKIEDYLKFSGDYKFVENILNHIPEPILIKNSKGEYLALNKAMEELIGYRWDQVVGKSVSICWQKKFEDEVNKADAAVLKTGISSTFETTCEGLDGKSVQLMITKYKINLPVNNEPGILTIATDITSTKRVENLLEIQYTIDFLASLNEGLKKTFSIILEKLFSLYWIDGGGIYLWDKNKRELCLESHMGFSDEFVDEVKCYGEDSAQVRFVFNRTNVYLQVELLEPDIRHKTDEEGIRFLALIPLIDKSTGELIGCLNLASRKYIEISDQDKKSVESIASRIVHLVLFAQNRGKLKEANLFLEQKVEEKTAELRKKMEDIRVREEKYKLFQENIPSALFSTDLKGNILYGNQATVKLFGFESMEEGKQYSVLELYHSKDQRDEILQTLISQGYLPETEVRLLRKDKSSFWGLVRANLISDDQGNPIQIDGVIADITEIKNSRFQLEEANKKITLINQNLEEKIREALTSQDEQSSLLIQKSKLESLGELAAGIAHEINQPLGVMALTFENLKLKINAQSFDPQYLETKFDSIEENIKRIRDIIDHVRLFSREQDSFVLDKVNVNKIITRALSLIGVQFGNHNININLKLEEKIGFTVGSNLKLEQVVLNLLSNSKYALDEKAVYLGEPDFPKEILIKTETTSNRIFIMIEDNGIGININHLPYIFDPFFTTKPEGFGTGLGLSIVYGLVKDMRGEILVNSREKEYTKFRISFPRFPEND